MTTNNLVIAERTKFLTSKQELNEMIIQYINKLQEASRFCDFEKLGAGEMTIEDKLIQLRLIEILEHLQLSKMSLDVCV